MMMAVLISVQGVLIINLDPLVPGPLQSRESLFKVPWVQGVLSVSLPPISPTLVNVMYPSCPLTSGGLNYIVLGQPLISGV